MIKKILAFTTVIAFICTTSFSNILAQSADLYDKIKSEEPLIDIEYISPSMIVLQGEEDNLLLLNGNLTSFWHAIDLAKQNGYSLQEITESGMGSQGNPTRFYAIMSK